MGPSARVRGRLFLFCRVDVVQTVVFLCYNVNMRKQGAIAILLFLLWIKLWITLDEGHKKWLNEVECWYVYHERIHSAQVSALELGLFREEGLDV